MPLTRDEFRCFSLRNSPKNYTRAGARGTYVKYDKRDGQGMGGGDEGT